VRAVTTISLASTEASAPATRPTFVECDIVPGNRLLAEDWAGRPKVPCSVLHRTGFFMPRRLLGERWALTPPFHPYPTTCVERRYVLCDTFRHTPFSKRMPACSPRCAVRRCSDFPLKRPTDCSAKHLSGRLPPAAGSTLKTASATVTRASLTQAAFFLPCAL
jgi:hypothetical protein